MSAGFNVETYQLGKQDGINSGTGNVSQEVLDRIQKLENSQMNIANEYYCDFSKAEYIDKYKSTTEYTRYGIIPKQYKDNFFDSFDNDDIVDWDKCKSIGKVKGVNLIKLDSDTTLYGEFYTLPIKLKPFIGFKFNANIKIPTTENFEGQQEIKGGSLWFAQGTDNYGRVWMFRCDTYKYEAADVYLTIYNKDMSVYKDAIIIPGSKFFGPVTAVPGYGYSPCHNTASIIFSEENLCIIGFMMINAHKNGTDFQTSTVDSNNHHYEKNIITFVDENGNSSVKYNYINQNMTNYNYWCVNNHSSYHANFQPFFPARLSIQKNKIVYLSPVDARIFKQWNYDQGRCGKVILTPITGLLNDVNVTMTMKDWYGYYYEDNVTHWQNWCTRHASKSFKLNGISYSVITDYIKYDGSIGLGNIYISELKAADGTDTFSVDNKLTLSGTLATENYIFGFGGANGIHYSEVHKQLFVFSNSRTSNVINVTRFDVDWNARVLPSTMVINLKNPKTKSITISNTTYWGDSDFYLHYNERLKVFEDKDKLSLIYGSKNPITQRQQINYLSIDFDLDIIQPETQIHVSDGSAVNNVVNFDMIMLEDKNIILYSQGDRNDYNDATAEPNSHIYTPISKSINSKLTFYYATDTDLTWKAINLGEQRTLPKFANDIRIKAVLESNKRYNTSPSIRGLYVESWDNDHQESRQSEYYSNQISSMQNEGKAVLTADYDLNDGAIDWYVSYDGGINYSKINLNEEFVYTHVETPDFRIKAVLSVKDNAVNLPIVRSYTLKSTHVVLHSDLEEIQVNLMKTNFKIDTFTKASRNGLFKMVTDVFTNEDGIDKTKSDYLPFPLLGAVGGNYIVTVPQEISSSLVSVLITASEELDETDPNSKINYFASLDDGVTYMPIYPNVKAQLSNTNASKNTITIRAVFYGNAKLSALGIAWD